MKKLRIARQPKAFTIIEVVIVLAIAGLIMTMVLIAVRAASSSRRDTKRIQDVGTLATALEQFAQNDNGSFPVAGTDITYTGSSLNTASNFCSQNYLNCSSFNDPSSGSAYTFTTSGANASFPASPLASAPALSCSSANVGLIQVIYTSTRLYNIQMCLERGPYTYVPQ